MAFSAASKIATCLSRVNFTPGYLLIRIISFLVGAGLGIFDSVTDWQLVIRFQENGFNHPLIPINLSWLHALYIFASIGVVLTAITQLNESMHLFYKIREACKDGLCRCKSSGSRGSNKNNLIQEDEHCSMDYEMKEERKDDSVDTSEVVIKDACKCCYRYGWNFTTRAETLAKFSLWFQDVPMLTLAIMYAYSQSTCKLPEVRDVTGDLFSVGLSAVASMVAVTYRVGRSLVRLCISVGFRVKSKKEASKMKGKCGKFFSRFLPEKGEAIYPQGTCARYCIIPFYISVLFDLVLVFFGFFISLAIWINYFSLKRTPNFDDSLAIFRLTHEGKSVPLLNISNNIIPASNGTFVSFETVLEAENDEVTYCLSEFEYREKDFKIFFNAIEVQAISDKGEFCATKSGEDLSDFDAYSRCNLYYIFSGFPLFYGSTNRITGKITRFDEECIVVEGGLPKSSVGPELDRTIQVEKNIDRTLLPRSPKDLLILYYSPPNITHPLFMISVADIVAGDLDKMYVRTFQDPFSRANVTYLVRFWYYGFQARFYFNVKRVFNYPPNGNQSCSCSTNSENDFKGFNKIGLLVYGYYHSQTGQYVPLLQCSEIPPIRVIPQYTSSLPISCSLC